MNPGASDTQIKDIMTTKIVAAQLDDSVLDIAHLMVEKTFDGLPVIDHDHKLVGMVTMKELLDNNCLYLPTVVKILKGLKVSDGRDVGEVYEKLQSFKNLKARNIMNRQPFYLTEEISLDEAAEAFLLRREDPLPVVDREHHLVGIVAKYDILKSLTHPLAPITLKPDLTMQTDPINVVRDLKKKFVVVSRLRLRFWYIGFFVFLAIGMAVATILILRVRI